MHAYASARTPCPPQRGSAVIGALLIVAVVTVIAASLMARQTAFIRTVQSDQTRAQSRLLLDSGLQWGVALLRSEGRTSPVTQLDGKWAVPVLRTRFGGMAGSTPGVFSGRIDDEQAKFNLRNVMRNGVIDPDEVGAFERLCTLVGVKNDVAGRIVQRIILAQPRGADIDTTAGVGDPSTTGQPPGIMATLSAPPTVPQAPMIRTIDDLRPVPGVDDDVLARLRPVVTVLPANTWINANTSGPEVLAAWVPGLSVEQAANLLADRDQGTWFINRGDFVNRLHRPDLVTENIRIGVTSNWFGLSGAVSSGRSTVVMHALLERSPGNGNVQVVWVREGG